MNLTVHLYIQYYILHVCWISVKANWPKSRVVVYIYLIDVFRRITEYFFCCCKTFLHAAQVENHAPWGELASANAPNCWLNDHVLSPSMLLSVDSHAVPSHVCTLDGFCISQLKQEPWGSPDCRCLGVVGRNYLTSALDDPEKWRLYNNLSPRSSRLSHLFCLGVAQYRPLAKRSTMTILKFQLTTCNF